MTVFHKSVSESPHGRDASDVPVGETPGLDVRIGTRMSLLPETMHTLVGEPSRSRCNSYQEGIGPTAVVCYRRSQTVQEPARLNGGQGATEPCSAGAPAPEQVRQHRDREVSPTKRALRSGGPAHRQVPIFHRSAGACPRDVEQFMKHAQFTSCLNQDLQD